MRIGELLAALGAVALAALLAFGAWFDYDVVSQDGQFSVTGAVGARSLGWFALLLVVLAAAAGLIYLARVLTARSTEPPMLQAPIAFVAALFALLVASVRMLLFTPNVEVEFGQAATRLGIRGAELPAEIALGGWLGLLALLLLTAGTWISMADERSDSAAARAQTEALLADIPVRPAPPAGGGASESEASAVEQDAVPDVASEPSTDEPTPGAPA